jgi:Asp-tRNA(Asn)/Glu-tRNA(Gln) amidotransferase A subunit family amidase
VKLLHALSLVEALREMREGRLAVRAYAEALVARIEVSDAALGTQTNGSVIRPAAYCNLVGFKPTLGVIPFDDARLLAVAAWCEERLPFAGLVQGPRRVGIGP